MPLGAEVNRLRKRLELGDLIVVDLVQKFFADKPTIKTPRLPQKLGDKAPYHTLGNFEIISRLSMETVEICDTYLKYAIF